MVEQIWIKESVNSGLAMFKALSLLQQQATDDQFFVTSSGTRWLASFEWFPPVASNRIKEIEETIHMTLPKDYKDFLGLTNGAVLFYDAENGQWGYRLYGTEELLERQIAWKSSFPNNWATNIVAFGELYGEASVLVFDMQKPTRDFMSYTVLEGNAYERVDGWPILSRSFHEWLNHLIAAQGEKYWEWF